MSCVFNEPKPQKRVSAGVASARVSAALALAALFVNAAAEPATAAGRSVSARPISVVQRNDTPRTVLISLRKQRLRLLDGTSEIANSRISSGQPGFDTPTGVFSILEKSVYHESNIYEGAPMPFMQRVTWSGIAMHAGVVPGYRASHGCVRLPYAFAKSFFDKTSVGARVIITQDEVNPVKFEHPTLFKPLPANDPAPAAQTSNSQEPRVAVAETGAGGGVAMANLMVIQPAAAAEQPVTQTPAKPRSRAEAQRMLEAKLQRLTGELKTAEQKKNEASEKAKAAMRAADEADARLKQVRQPFEGVLKAVSTAEQSRASAQAAYRTFLMGTGRGSRTQQASDKELDLEDRILDLTMELDKARADAAGAELTIADAKTAFAAADAKRAKATEEVQSAIVDLRKAQTALVDLKSDITRRARPLSIFISLKAQRIYVRQGFEPVAEGTIDVDDPPGAIGTHVLTVMDYDQTGDDFVWQLISAQQPRPAVDDADTKSKKKREPEAVGARSPINVEAARVALDAIKLPGDIADMIKELARPGTSVIISEKDLSRETGKGTEFVVLTR